MDTNHMADNIYKKKNTEWSHNNDISGATALG